MASIFFHYLKYGWQPMTLICNTLAKHACMDYRPECGGRPEQRQNDELMKMPYPNNGRPTQAGVVDAKPLANVFLDWAENQSIEVTPMKLQKLLYFAHAECIATVGVVLIRQEFEAWNYGPVIPSIYQEFKSEGRGPIIRRAKQFNPKTASSSEARCEIPEDVIGTVQSAFDAYAPRSAEQLSYISHVFDGPWFRARQLFDCGKNMDRRISNDLIAARYELKNS